MNKIKSYHIYCDESRQTKDRFMLIGGIMIPQNNIQSISEKLIQFKNEQHSNNLMKWSEIKNHKLDLYQRWVEFGFHLIEDSFMQFKVVTIDNHQLNNKLYNNGSSDMLINKGVYQLVSKKFILPIYNNYNIDESNFKIIFDRKQTQYPLENYIDIFNNGLRKETNNSNLLINSIESIDESNSVLLQLVDILIGGVGYYKNGYLNEKSNKTKGLLSKYICKKIGFNNIKYNSPKSAINCSIWNIDFSK